MIIDIAICLREEAMQNKLEALRQLKKTSVKLIPEITKSLGTRLKALHKRLTEIGIETCIANLQKVIFYSSKFLSNMFRIAKSSHFRNNTQIPHFYIFSKSSKCIKIALRHRRRELKIVPGKFCLVDWHHSKI